MHINNRKKEYPLEVINTHSVERMTFGKLIKDIGSAFNVERGLVYTIKMLFINPGGVIRNFLYEGRHKVFHPVRFLVISSALSFLFLSLLDNTEFRNDFITGWNSYGEKDSETLDKMISIFNDLFENYFNLIIWFQIPVFGTFTYLLFKKSGFNFTENLVWWTYITSVINLISIITYLMMAFSLLEYSMLFSLITSFGYTLYALKSFFERSWWASIYRITLVYTIGFSVYFIIISIFITIYVAIKFGA